MRELWSGVGEVRHGWVRLGWLVRQGQAGQGVVREVSPTNWSVAPFVWRLYAGSIPAVGFAVVARVEACGKSFETYYVNSHRFEHYKEK